VSEPREALLKLLGCGVALVGLALLSGGNAWAARHRQRLLAGLAALGALAYVNFGGFHTDGTPQHVWDQYHYFVGSKYFAELGYDGLYVATLQARREALPGFEMPARVRDLRTNRTVPAVALADHARAVRARFTDERWSRFRKDVSAIWLGPLIFLDHGYNPTPAHAAVTQLFARWLPFGYRTITALAALDFLLLALAALALARAFGAETLAAALLVFGLGYCSRYYWVGGAFLRQDWLVALVACAAALKRQRPALAGAALAYAGMVRVFPFLVLVPLAVHAFAWRRQGPRVGRFALGFSAAALGLLVMGALAGRGAGAWVESVQRLAVHGSGIGPNAIGLRIPIITSLANLRGDLVDPSGLYEYAAIATDFARLSRERAVLIAIASAALAALALRAAWRSPDAVSAFATGVALVYAVSTVSCYYGSIFVLLVLARPLWTARLFLVATVLCYLQVGAVVALSRAGIIRLNGAAVYAPVSALLLVVLVVWLVRAAAAPDGPAPATVASR
jgi:hypothetical protein